MVFIIFQNHCDTSIKQDYHSKYKNLIQNIGTHRSIPIHICHQTKNPKNVRIQYQICHIRQLDPGQLSCSWNKIGYLSHASKYQGEEVPAFEL